jgi:hypothetical protein
MSGIVRRQPLATANNTAGSNASNMNGTRGYENADTVATIVTNPTNHSNLVSGGGKVASPNSQSGQRISFYPTSPHRQSNA